MTKFLLSLGGLVVLAILLFIGYTAFVLNWSYSEGERAGYLQKFSKKGWLCKTYEGEIAMSSIPGSMPIMFQFSVRDEAVAQQLLQLSGKPVTLQYEEHRGVPTNCYGETNYFVTSVKVR